MSIERLAIFIEAHGGKAIAEFKKVGLASKSLEGQVAGGTKAMGGLGQMGATAGNLLKAGLAGGATVAAGALVKFASNAVGATTKLAASIRDVQRITGGTAEEASKLVAILDDFEVPVETLNKGFFRLSREIGKNDKAFAGAGFSVARNAKGNVDLSATLLNIADAYKATEDPAKRATLLTAAFGRGGAELIPILEQGRGRIEEVFAEAGKVGQIFSQEDLDSAENYRLAMDDLHDATEQFSLTAGTALIPILHDSADAMIAAIADAKDLGATLKDIGDKEVFGKNFKGAFDKFTDWVNPAKLAAGTLFDLTRGASDAGGAFTELTGPLEDFAARVQALNTPLEEADKELDALSKALFSTADADKALVDADRDVKDAQADLNKLLKEGAVDAEKVADARRSLAEATRSAADADRGLAKAQKEYDKALAAANILGTDTVNDNLADAAEGLADAQDTVASAHERAQEAARDLKEAQAGDPEYQDKLADARRKVADATDNMSKRAYEHVLAEQAEKKAVSEHADQLQRLYDINVALIAQNPAIALALAPIQTALGAALPPPAGPTGARIPLPPGVSGPVLPASPVTTTNNVTINATTSEADARLIAKEVMWNLN